MSTNRRHQPDERDVTHQAVYRDRRRLMAAGVALAGLAMTAGHRLARALPVKGPLEAKSRDALSTDETLTDKYSITHYNNFYEFGTGKSDPANYAGQLSTRPWRVEIAGHCAKPGDYHVDDLIDQHPLEERIYRLRCVEAWSMVIPWIGVPLASILKRAEPDSRAKYVAFTTLYRPQEMPGQRRAILEWPYREGLRIDEAMHPLTILAVGLYGEVLPNQNGAPLRLVVPWKYGFKSIKSIVRIEFTERRPQTTWNLMAPHEYGFYANVNPNVDHPRWSQARERRIGEFFKRDTLMFNGYAEQVASLYRGMNLTKNF